MGILDAPPGYSRAQADAKFQTAYGTFECVLATGQAAASANVAALNAAIQAANTKGGGIVTVSLPGTYYFNDHILMRSNVTLRSATGVVYKKVDSMPGNVCLLRNANILGARPFGDSNMVIDGGIWDGNYANNSTSLVWSDINHPAANTTAAGIQGDIALIGVVGVVVKNITIRNCNGFGLQILGDNWTISDITLSTARDGIHVNGPSRGFRIDKVFGYSDDDFIALNAWDWHRSGPAVGDIENGSVNDCAYLGTSGLRGTYGKGIKLLPGTRTTGDGQGVGNIRNVKVTNLSVLDGNGVGILSDFDQVNGAEYSGAGTVRNVTFDTCRWRPAAGNTALSIYKDANGTPADGQTQLTLTDVVFRNIDIDCATNSITNAITVSYPYTGLSMAGVVFRDVVWTPKSGAGNLMNLQSKSAIDGLEIDGVQIAAAITGTSPIVLVNNYSGSNQTVVKNLGVHRITTAPGVTVDSPVISLNGIVNQLTCRDWVMAFTGGASDNHGIYLQTAAAQVVTAVLASLVLSGIKELLSMSNGANGAPVSFTARDCIITACTHPIYVRNTRTVGAHFRGGSIDTPNNLARVDTGTLNLTLDGTTSSGTGASTITLVNAGVARVLRSDRISLPLNTLALTPADGDTVMSSGTPSTVVSGTGAGLYAYRGGAGWVKLN